MPMPRKSVEQHSLEGTKPHYQHESQFPGGRPKFPGHLSRGARAEAKRIVALLEARRTITPGDVAAVVVFAEVFARWIQAKRELGDELMVETTVLDSNGQAHTTTKLNPLLKVVEVCEARLLALAKTLGLTPVDRERARPTKDATPKEPDPMEQFLSRKNVVPMRREVPGEEPGTDS